MLIPKSDHFKVYPLTVICRSAWTRVLVGSVGSVSSSLSVTSESVTGLESQIFCFRF